MAENQSERWERSRDAWPFRKAGGRGSDVPTTEDGITSFIGYNTSPWDRRSLQKARRGYFFLEPGGSHFPSVITKGNHCLQTEESSVGRMPRSALDVL